MTALPHSLPRLLPNGIDDRLPPTAFARQKIMGDLLQFFYHQGYEFIDPPLLEYATSLSSLGGEDIINHSFASFDPLSGKPLVIRSDMTIGVARIAADKLATSPRPLKLCYGGDIVRQEAINGKKQLTQVGVEIIGGEKDIAILETLFQSLDGMLTRPIWCDFALPAMTHSILNQCPDDIKKLAENYIRHKDVASLKAMNNKTIAPLIPLLTTTGLCDDILPKLADDKNNQSIGTMINQLIELINHLKQKITSLAMPPNLSIDITELLGFDYKTGFAFTLFDQQLKTTLGRGGHYRVMQHGKESGEEAVGFSLYLDNLLPMVKPDIINPNKKG
ncbi:MAG: ATP phosphoribosyltransferase regulatory subunit [Alphaproteobacteria bacterium]